MASKYRMSSSDGEVASSSSSGSRDAGCYVSSVHGFIFLLLAVAIAVGVGIVVFFAGGREVVCQCGQVPEVGTTSGPPTMSPEAVRQMCIDVIMAGDGEAICSSQACSVENGTEVPLPTATPALPTAASPSATATVTPSAPAPTEAPLDYRLPITVRPYLYTLELQPNIYGGENGTFDFVGSVKIATFAESSANTITLHAHSSLWIELNTIRVTNVNTSQWVGVSSFTYERLREFFTLHLYSPLVVGHHYLLEMTFSGPLTQSGSGLYLSQYEENGKKVFIATSQLQATNARKAFPCFDEPDLKAQFDIALIRQESGEREYISLSNTHQIRNESLGNGMVKDIYERTAPMSTYLLGFIVCDYKYLEGNISNIMYRTWAMPQRLEFAETAQRHGLKIFEKYTEYFKPEYVYSKLDNVPIPDFGGGAMENWGVIIYRDTMLYEPGVSSASDENWIAEVVSHEIAHQWFGNLVTPKWWGLLWMNEAFATFWGVHIVDEIYPDWRMWDVSQTGPIHGAFSSDSLRTSHAMNADVEMPGQISSIFDAITYYKGSAVVRMMHLAMGQELFIKGLNRYLIENSFNSVDQHDLWRALTEEATANNVALNMTEIMDPWVSQMNFPVVNVTINRNKGQVTLTQQRFLLSGSESENQDVGAYGYKWTIPITYTTSDSPNFTTDYIYSNVHYMKYYEDTVVLNVTVPADGWIIVNLRQMGFYRVNYDQENWDNILNFLANDDLEVIHPVNRAQLINDAWNLAKAEMLPQDVALRTINHLSKDLDYAPWRAFIRELGYIENMLERTSIFGMFEEFMHKTVSVPYTTLGTNMTEDMPPIEKLEKSQIVSQACNYGYQPCVDAAVDAFTTWTNNVTNNPISPDIRYTFYCAVIRHGGFSEWSFVYDQYHLTEGTAEKSRLRRALTCTKEPWLLQRLLDMSINASEIRPQDSWDTITYVARSRWGRELAWNFVTHHFDLLSNIVQTFSGISRLVLDITDKFNTPQEHKQVEDFMNNNDVSAAGSAFTQVLERTRTNMEWLEENFDVFKEWLRTETANP